ncbi:hypothetical protein [Candidatus Hodarchaeum mangrovi]
MNKMLMSNSNKIHTRIAEFRSRQKKQAIFATSIWLLLAMGLTVVITPIFQIYESPLRNLITSFVIVVVFLSWISYIPFIGILIVIILRTRSKNYLNQLIPNFGLLIVITFVALSPFIELKEDDVITIIFTGFMLLLIILESIFLRSVIQGARQNTKPLFLWSFYQDPFFAFQGTIITQHSLSIEEENDGYSQRPFFLNFSEIIQFCPTLKHFKEKIKDYASFLTERSELVGWDSEKDVIKLYPRVLIGKPDLGLGITYLWSILKKMIRKVELTYVSINYDKKEISLRINKDDYNLLHDVTFHLLGQSILNQFKLSIIEFLNNNPEKAYSILYLSSKGQE